MRNVHVLATDEPSRLIVYSTLLNEYRLLRKPIKDWKHKKHIYITNLEKSSIGDWVKHGKIDYIYKVSLENYEATIHNKSLKIITCSDENLIKDGVQPIDDEFLEWFVSNSNCEKVEIMKLEKQYVGINKYEIIIPEEEATQTAVEWLITQIDDMYLHHIYNKEFKQAKEIEKQQIIDAYELGQNDSDTRFPSFLDGEEYYNETFKKC